MARFLLWLLFSQWLQGRISFFPKYFFVWRTSQPSFCFGASQPFRLLQNVCILSSSFTIVVCLTHLVTTFLICFSILVVFSYYQVNIELQRRNPWSIFVSGVNSLFTETVTWICLDAPDNVQCASTRGGLNRNLNRTKTNCVQARRYQEIQYSGHQKP